MKRNKPLPGSRLFLATGSAVGLVRAAEESLAELRAPKEPIDPTVKAEPSDVNARNVFLVGIGILLVLWAIVVALYPLFIFFKYDRTGGRVPEKVLQYVPPPPPLPRNEEHPNRELDEFRAREEHELSSYQWVDRGKGVVSIPIGQAIQIVAQRGIAPSPAGGKEYYNPSAGSKLTGTEGKVRPEPR